MFYSHRDRLIEQLTAELQALKEELESFRLEVSERRRCGVKEGEACLIKEKSNDGWEFLVSLDVMLIAGLSQLLSQSGRLCQALRGRVSELEAELAEQSHLKQQALSESEFLKAELDDLRRVKEDTEKEQRSLTEIESKTFLPHFAKYSSSSCTHSLRTFSCS